MLVQVDWYKETGKWACRARVEVDAPAYESSRILIEIVKNQNELIKRWEIESSFFVVVSDILESENDPNYRMTYSRLYTPERIKEIVKNAKE